MCLISYRAPLSSFNLHPGVVDPLLSLHEPSSLMTTSACRGSASMSMLSSLQVITLLSDLLQIVTVWAKHPPDLDDVLCSESPQHTSSNRHSCLTPLSRLRERPNSMSDSLCLKMQADEPPALTPNSIFSQECAASLVPYNDFFGLPQLPSSFWWDRRH